MFAPRNPGPFSQPKRTAWKRIATLTTLTTLGLVADVGTAHARKKKQPTRSLSEDINALFADSGAVSAMQEAGGVSLIAGAAVGAAVKAAVKMSLAIAGGAFLFLKLLESQGMVTVNYKTLQKKIIAVLDQNGDGTLDSKDLEAAHKKFLASASVGLPSASGFATGFALAQKFL